MAEVDRFPSFSAVEQASDNVHIGQVTALLDHGASFEGRLSFEGTVRIGGTFQGEIFTNDTLVINPGAKVEAQIEADVVIISGIVKGNIFARSRVVMHPPAVFKGTVTTPSLRIDEGVVFEGASYMPKT
ncbi:MAG: polymer-forming cytoskeletal protein [Bdellovibrionales bacterium]|nr:polymer-forming cytoskeletal protein [Bdellovibrionales bacterium]